MTIEYKIGGIVCSTFEERGIAKEIVTKFVDVDVATYGVLEWVRLIVAINPELAPHIKIKFRNEIITINEIGQFSEYPKGFGDSQEFILANLFKRQSGEKNPECKDLELTKESIRELILKVILEE